MSLPLSICIPTYNRATLLNRTLNHLADCQNLFGEVIISDNASSDQTQEIVAEWQSRIKRLRYTRQKENVGVLRNIYAVQALATEKFSFVLSDDDALIPSGIYGAVAVLEADPECVAVYGGYERCDADLEAVISVTLPPYPGRYTRNDKVALSRNANMLTFAAVRSSVVQRHCFRDDTTFGFLRMIAQLLDHGVVQIVSYPLYQHAETADRLEGDLIEAYYHDRVRSDWELYAASIEGGDPQATINMVLSNTLPIYLLSSQVALNKDLPLFERTFLLRYSAYLGKEISDQRDAWERNRLVAAAIALLKERISIFRPKRLIVEQGPMNLPAMIADARKTSPELSVLEIAGEAFQTFAAEDGDFLVSENWEALETRRAATVQEVAQLAMGDIIASLRLPQSSRQRFLLGPAGSLHIVVE